MDSSSSSERAVSRSSQRDGSTSPEDQLNTIKLDDMLLNERIWRGGLFTEQELQIQSSRTQIKKPVIEAQSSRNKERLSRRQKYVTRVQSLRRKVHYCRKQGQSPSAAAEAKNSANYNQRKRKRISHPQDSQVISTEKYILLKRKYFNHYNTIVNTWRRRKSKILLKQRKEKIFLAYFLSEFREFISSELRKTDLKLRPLILLKAFYYFFVKAETVWEKNVSVKTFCINSLKKFLMNPMGCSNLGYLCKDIAADILSELGVDFFNGITFSKFQEKFCDPQMRQDEFYGTVMAWMLNIMTESSGDPKNVQRRLAESSDILTSKFINYPRVFYKVMSVLESHNCCITKELIDSASSTKTDNSEDDSLNEKPIYDQTLVTQMNKLIRNENMYTPLFHFKYEPSTSRPFDFSSMFFKEIERSVLSHFPNEKIQDEPSDPLSGMKFFPDDFYTTEPKSSYIEDDKFWKAWDRFTPIIENTRPDRPTIYCGYVDPSVDLNSPYAWEKANTFLASVPVSEMNSSSKKNEFESFIIPDINTLYVKLKKPIKKGLPPPPFIPLDMSRD